MVSSPLNGSYIHIDSPVAYSTYSLPSYTTRLSVLSRSQGFCISDMPDVQSPENLAPNQGTWGRHVPCTLLDRCFATDNNATVRDFGYVTQLKKLSRRRNYIDHVLGEAVHLDAALFDVVEPRSYLHAAFAAALEYEDLHVAHAPFPRISGTALPYVSPRPRGRDFQVVTVIVFKPSVTSYAPHVTRALKNRLEA